MGITYISWARHCTRSDYTARELGGTSHMVYWTRLGSHPLTVWLKYLGQAVRTWRILATERPRAVFVMTPPPVAPLVVLSYCVVSGAALVMDAHTAAFMHPRWRYFQWLQFWLCRRARTTIVTNEHLKQLVETNGGHATVVPDVPVHFETGETYELTGEFNVAVVCSFNPDEPIQEIFEAARGLPDVQFYVTGNPRRLDRSLALNLPANVHLTGFLSEAAYGFLLRNADAVMSLTTRDHTMLRGAWEAVYLGTPIIISNWPVLREAFAQGAVHVDSVPDDIRHGVMAMRDQIEKHRRDVLALRSGKRQRWEENKESLIKRIHSSDAPPPEQRRQ